MAKKLVDAVLDGLLDVLATATKITVCNAEPTTYTEANATFALADVVVDSGDFAKANGDSSGRKVTVAAQSAVPIDASGTATHIAYIITGSSTLLGCTTCTSQALTSGGTVDIPAHKVEVADPT
jgi:hypothetical protein